MILSVSLAVFSRFVGLLIAARTIETRLRKLIDLANIFRLLLVRILVGFIAKELITLVTDNATGIFILGGILHLGLLLVVDRLFHLKILATALSFAKRN